MGTLWTKPWLKDVEKPHARIGRSMRPSHAQILPLKANVRYNRRSFLNLEQP